MRLDEVEITCIDPDTGERVREDFGDLEELKASIQANELIEPIAVHYQGDNQQYKLLAGGRRLEACRQLGLVKVPVRIYDGEMSSIQIKSIELAENLHRKNFTPLEEVLIKKKIHLLQMEIHGPKRERTPDAPGWSMRDTAAMLGESPASISQDLALADAINDIPELLTAKNKSEAKKMLDKILKMESNKSLAESLLKKDTEVKDKISKTILDCFLCIPFLDNMDKIPDGKADLIFLNNTSPDMLKPSSVHGLFRIMSGNSWLLVLIPTGSNIHDINIRLTGVNLKPVQPAYLLLSGVEKNERPDITLSRCVSQVMIYRKGNPALNNAHSDAFTYAKFEEDFPVSLYSDLFSTFCYSGATVIIPDMRTGNPILGCANCGVKSFGYNQSETIHNDFIIRAHQGKPGEYK